VAEQVGVESRAGYYEQSGCLRDMIQNHAMQLLALTAMEPPVSMDAESVRDEKVKVLKAIQPFRVDGPNPDVARAQYGDGLIGGKPVKGYLQEKDVAPASTTETYAALRFSINNWRSSAETLSSSFTTRSRCARLWSMGRVFSTGVSVRSMRCDSSSLKSLS